MKLIENYKTLIELILTATLVVATILMNIHTVREYKEKRSALIKVMDGITPSTFEFIYDNLKTNDIKEVIVELRDKKKYLHDKEVDSYGNVVREANYSELTVDQKNSIKEKCDSVYFEPLSIEDNDTKVGMGSLVLNLLSNENPGDGLCFCKNLTRIRIKNYGAPVSSAYIKECVIEYTDNRTPRTPNPNKTEIPLIFDVENGEASIDLSEVTENFTDSLCNVKYIDMEKSVSEIEYSKKFFNYKKITFDVVVTSVYGVKTTFRIVMLPAGEKLSFQTYPI